MNLSKVHVKSCNIYFSLGTNAFIAHWVSSVQGATTQHKLVAPLIIQSSGTTGQLLNSNPECLLFLTCRWTSAVFVSNPNYIINPSYQRVFGARTC